MPTALLPVLGTRGPFARFGADFLAAHCRASLRPLPQGGFTLACPPAVESRIFHQHRLADTWQRLPAATEESISCAAAAIRPIGAG